MDGDAHAHEVGTYVRVVGNLRVINGALSVVRSSPTIIITITITITTIITRKYHNRYSITSQPLLLCVCLVGNLRVINGALSVVTP
jgi:hypothetical protein